MKLFLRIMGIAFILTITSGFAAFPLILMWLAAFLERRQKRRLWMVQQRKWHKQANLRLAFRFHAFHAYYGSN